MSASTAIAAMPAGILGDLQTKNQTAGFLLSGPAAELQIAIGKAEGVGSNITGQHGEQSFTCTVCRKVFKREMNLIFHITTHRPRQPQLESSDPVPCQPVNCQDCGKEFATKYQAKKHYLRRHFQGKKPFACPKCNKKCFVVKEDLTMHMKSCGNVYVCKCGVRLCSLGALKRHCKYFNHEPEAFEPRPDPSMPNLYWEGLDGAGPTTGRGASIRSNNGARRPPAAELMNLQSGQMLGGGVDGQLPMTPACGAGRMPASTVMHSELVARLRGKDLHPMHSYLALSAPMRPLRAAGYSGDTIHANSTSGPISNAIAQGFADNLPVAAAPAHSAHDNDGVQESSGRLDQHWTPEMLYGMMPSLAQALSQAQADRIANMEQNTVLINSQQRRQQATVCTPSADQVTSGHGNFYHRRLDVRAVAERTLMARGDMKRNCVPFSTQQPVTPSAMDALVRSQGQVAYVHRGASAPSTCNNATPRDGDISAGVELSTLGLQKKMLRDNESTEPPC